MLVDLITGQECRILNPRNILTRISAGVRAGQKIQEQAIAANIDALFIVTSANNEFNESRLERYLALAKKYEVKPVIIITKNDLIKDGQSYRKRALAITDTPILLVDARDKKLKSKLNQWLKIGNTIAVFGSSGVGKSTILNTLAGSNIQKTGTVRVTDNRGRHTTTSRTIHLLKDGPMILDTPGIRELTLAPSKEVLSEIFADIETFFHSCKFANCTHNSEPGCAIQEALEQEKLISGGSITIKSYVQSIYSMRRSLKEVSKIILITKAEERFRRNVVKIVLKGQKENVSVIGWLSVQKTKFRDLNIS